MHSVSVGHSCHIIRRRARRAFVFADDTVFARKFCGVTVKIIVQRFYHLFRLFLLALCNRVCIKAVEHIFVKFIEQLCVFIGEFDVFITARNQRVSECAYSLGLGFAEPLTDRFRDVAFF